MPQPLLGEVGHLRRPSEPPQDVLLRHCPSQAGAKQILAIPCRRHDQLAKCCIARVANRPTQKLLGQRLHTSGHDELAPAGTYRSRDRNNHLEGLGHRECRHRWHARSSGRLWPLVLADGDELAGLPKNKICWRGDCEDHDSSQDEVAGVDRHRDEQAQYASVAKRLL